MSEDRAPSAASCAPGWPRGARGPDAASPWPTVCSTSCTSGTCATSRPRGERPTCWSSRSTPTVGPRAQGTVASGHAEDERAELRRRIRLRRLRDGFRGRHGGAAAARAAGRTCTARAPTTRADTVPEAARGSRAGHPRGHRRRPQGPRDARHHQPPPRRIGLTSSRRAGVFPDGELVVRWARDPGRRARSSRLLSDPG